MIQANFVGATESETAIDASPRSWTRTEVLADPRFHLMLPYLLAPAFISTGIMFHKFTSLIQKGGRSSGLRADLLLMESRRSLRA